jgi:4'-phosphopantetheinyl transferase
VLGHVLGLAPGPLRFRRNAYGRPELDPPGRLRFNLTNTVELVAIAVTDEGDVGIDAEPRSRADSILGLGSAVFTPTERADLSMLPIEMRRARAMHRWTLKEAYMKARGLGFSLPPASFEIDFSNGGPALRLMPPIEDLASRWHLELREIDDHVLAICRARGPTTVVMHRADLRKLLREADD